MAELTIRPEEIRDALDAFVQSYEPGAASREEVGRVSEAGDGIARVEGLPSAAAWEVLPNEECAILRSVPSVKAPVVPAKDRSLPPSCATELEGVCTSRDGRLRVFTYFEGTYKARKVRSGFHGGEDPLEDKFYSGRRILGFEDVASGKRALFVERLKRSRGYSAPSGRISYLPEAGIVLVLGIGPEEKPPVSYCIRLPARENK